MDAYDHVEQVSIGTALEQSKSLLEATIPSSFYARSKKGVLETLTLLVAHNLRFAYPAPGEAGIEKASHEQRWKDTVKRFAKAA